MCRKWGGGPLIGAHCGSDVSFLGEEKISLYSSSDWAERGFCEICGSTLWYGTVHDGALNLSAGLFDNAAGAEMKIEFFADAAPKGYALAGDHKKLTTQETIALFAPDEDAQ